MTNQLPSRVLLICIYDTVVFDLTNEMLYASFSEVCPVKKILIFEKGQMTKGFVQFYSCQDAIKIKEKFDRKKLFQTYCKMHIYYSLLKEIDLKNQYYKGLNFTGQDYDLNISYPFIQNIMVNSTSINSYPQRQNNNNQVNLLQQESLSFCKTPNISDTQEELHQKIKLDILNNILADQDDMPLQLKSGQQNVILNTNQFNLNKNEILKNNHFLYNQLNGESFIGQKESQLIKNRTNIISFEYRHQITIKQVYNLFSNFGNIEKIVKKQNLFCFIQFSNIEFAAIAKDYLHSKIFYGNIMKIIYANPNQLSQKPRQYMESITYDPSYYRFSSKKSISINPPSCTLHVSNFKKQICSEIKLNSIFSEFGKVQRISILLQSKQKNMALVKFFSMQDSFKAVANLHNHDIMNRKLQISFTKSKV